VAFGPVAKVSKSIMQWRAMATFLYF